MADFAPPEEIPIDDFNLPEDDSEDLILPEEDLETFPDLVKGWGWGAYKVEFKKDELTIPAGLDKLNRGQVEEMINNFYEHLTKDGWIVNKDAPILKKAFFTRTYDNKSRKGFYIVYKGKGIRLTKPHTEKLSYGGGVHRIPDDTPNYFNSLKAIQKAYGRGGADFIRNVLGVKNYISGNPTPHEIAQGRELAVEFFEGVKDERWM